MPHLCLGSPLRTCQCAAVDAPSQKSPKMENIRYEVVNDVNDSNDAPLTSTIFRSVVSPELGCSFVVGDFIVFGSHENVGQIDIIMDDMSLKVNCWLRFASQLLPEEQSSCGPIDQNTHSRVLDVPEVLKTNGFVSIEVGDIVDHAFVMHIDTIQDGTYPINGIENAFCTRKYLAKSSANIAGDVTFCYKDGVDHRPFSSTPFNGSLDDCFDPFVGLTCCHSSGEHVFDGIMVVITMMREMLFSRSKYQAFRNTRKKEMSLLQWKYIRSKLLLTADVVFKKIDRTDKIYLGDLSLIKNRNRHYQDSIKIENTESFEVLRKLFGRNFGIGVQKNFREVEGFDKACSVAEADILNVVGFTDMDQYAYTQSGGQVDCPAHVMQRKNGNQVTLRYDYNKKILYLSVAFTMVNATGNSDGEAVLNHVFPTNANYQIANDVNHVSVGTAFKIKKRLYRVLQKDSDGRYLCCRIIGGVQSQEPRHTKQFTASELQVIMSTDARADNH